MARAKKPKAEPETEPQGEPEPAKDLRGRPTKYKPEYDEIVRVMAERGQTNAEMAHMLDISVSTFHVWRSTYPSFGEAVKIGKAPADDRVEHTLYELATGYYREEEQAIKLRDKDGNERIEIVKVQKWVEPKERSTQYWLQNRRPDTWKDKSEKVHSGQITHKQVTPDEARAEIADFLRSPEGRALMGAPTKH